MGGGNKDFNKQQATINQQLTDAITAQKETPATQTALDQGTLDTLAWQNRTGKYADQPYDVTNLPGFGAYEDIYGNAEAAAAQHQQGNPMAAFARGANPMFAKQLEGQNQNLRYNTRAAGLSNAVSNQINQARAAAGNSVLWDMNRANAYTGALENQSQIHFGQKPKSGWDKFMDIAGLAIGGGKALGAGGLGWTPLKH